MMQKTSVIKKGSPVTREKGRDSGGREPCDQSIAITRGRNRGGKSCKRLRGMGVIKKGKGSQVLVFGRRKFPTIGNPTGHS